MRTKIKQIVLKLLLIPILFALAAPISLINSNMPVSAADNFSNATTDKKIQMWWYYNAMVQCVGNGLSVGLSSESDIKSGNWFPNGVPGFNVANGYYMRSNLDGIGSDGVTNCNENNNQLASKALQIWNTDGIQLLCGAGLIKRTNIPTPTDCIAGNGDFTFTTNSSSNPSLSQIFQKYLLSSQYGGTAPSLSNADKYLLSLQTLQNGCAYNAKVHTTKPAGGNVFEIRTFPSSDFSGTQGWVIGTRAPGDGVAYSTNPNTNRSCGDLSNDVLKYAKAYGVQQSCTVLYTDVASATACIAGGTHSGLIYCSTNYSIAYVGGTDHSYDPVAQRQACYIGQGNNGAEECSKNPVYKADVSLWQACIYGAQNSGIATYCDSNYGPAYSGSTLVSHPAQLAACQAGQKLTISNTSLTAVNVPPTGGSSQDGMTTCAIPGIGWMVCPVFNFFASLADGMYGIVASFLQTNPKIFDSQSGTFLGWEAMRNFANIGFVIAFLIIIFSQIANIGVTNYGVKKLLPRLVIAAILVNISYFICQISVDVSNILGKSLKDLMDGIPVFSSSLDNNALAQGNFFSKMVQTILAGNAVIGVFAGAAALAVFGGIGLMIPIILTAVVSIAVTLFILTARQALVILFVVISPLAFLAMLLPNTENYFKQWRKIFVALLIVYPAIGLLFGASHVAAGILSQTLGDLGAAVALALPLVAVPVILKNSLNAIPAIGNIASKLQDRATGNFRKQSTKSIAQSRIGQFAKDWQGQRDMKRAQMQGGTYTGTNRYRTWQSGINAKLNKSATLGGFGERSAASGTALSFKIQDEEVSNAETLIRNNTNASNRLDEAAKILAQAIKENDTVKSRAAQRILLTGGATGITKLADTLEAEANNPIAKDSTSVRALRSDLDGANLKGVHNGLATWAHNGVNESLSSTSTNTGTLRALNDGQLAGQTLRFLQNAKANGSISAEQAKTLINNQTVYKDLDEDKKDLFHSISGVPRT